MSIGMCFNDDVPWGFQKENRRLGMSVQEVYDSLNRLERLEKAYEEKRTECEKLNQAIFKAIEYNTKTAMDYRRVAESSDNNLDKIEFFSKASGLIESIRMLKEYLKGE